jgi:hypothetical protein
METTKATEQSQDSRRPESKLDDRYGKIGISAVAGAVRHQGARANSYSARQTTYDTD